MSHPNAKLPFSERFEMKFSRGAVESDCWLWTGAIGSSGYGAIKFKGSMYSAHRVSYERFVGPIPDDLVIDHLCRVRNCVNPSHLEPVTNAENIRRGESPSSRHARKTHCKRGHEFTPENTRPTPGSDHRACRTCIREAWRRRHSVSGS